MPPDDAYPNPDLLLAGYVRRAAKGLNNTETPDPQARLDAARRCPSNGVVGDLAVSDLREYELARALKAAEARVRHLEQALRAAGTVLKPYLGGNGR